MTLPAVAGTMPWVVTNPIYVRDTLRQPVTAVLSTSGVVLPVPGTGDPAAWTVEAAPGASGGGTPDLVQPRRVPARWQLGSGASTFAAMATAAPGDLAAHDRLVLRAFADRPMRVWVQLRSPAGGGRRWGRSIYLDTTPRAITLPLAAFLPLEPGTPQQPALSEVTALLLVADTTHARPGDHGVVTVDEWWMGH